MKKIIRNLAIVLLSLAALFVLVLFLTAVIPGLKGLFGQALGNMTLAESDMPYRYLVLFLVLVLFLFFLIRSIGARVRLRQTDIGTIVVSTDALESIALNSAKTAQSGVKMARSKVRNRQGKLYVNLAVNIYSDVEIPVMMARVQERVKKDLEHYSGLPVEGVEVKVAKVEEIAARVER